MKKAIQKRRQASLSEKALVALRKAVREVIKDHARTGDPMVIWQNGKVAWIPPAQLLRKETAMNTKIQKRGNSLVLRISRSIARDAHLHRGTVVDIMLIADKIVVKPKQKHQYTLAQLLKGVTARNRHAELRFI